MTEKLILRVYGDSRCKPAYSRNTPVTDIWEEQLKTLIESNNDIKVYLSDKSFGGTPVKVLYNNFNNDNNYWSPSKGIVIIFLGIVDCAPRPVHPWVRFIISKLNKSIRNKIISFLHNHRTSILKIKYYQQSPINVFRKYYSRLVRNAVVDNEVYCVAIGPVSQELKIRAYGLDKEIYKYNECIRNITENYENCHYVNLPELLLPYIENNKNTDDEIFIGDGHHFTSLGHKYIADIMYKQIMSNKYN